MEQNSTLPKRPLDRATRLQDICIAVGTYGGDDNASAHYETLRLEFMGNATLKPLLPDFIVTCRDTWQMRTRAQEVGGYRERRAFIWKAFRPLLDHLENTRRAPVDPVVSGTLATFDVDGVHAVWDKALSRRVVDPEGAITSARTLLETVCKRILDELGAPYSAKADLPKLYGAVAERLNLAPGQHGEETFRAILGSCQQVVERLGSLRNEFGDAHGKGKRPVKPQPRHAALAVNLAGGMALFLVETWLARQAKAAA